MIDRKGRPAMSPFTILRPRAKSLSLEVLWAVMNSPIANAFAYSHSSKWHILTGTWENFPVPKFETLNLSKLETHVAAYFEFLSNPEPGFQLRADDSHENARTLRDLHWRIDSEVLRLYGLPVELERELLDYFVGWKRAGVPFEQERYIPENFCEPISLRDFLAITIDWEITNSRREELLVRKRRKSIHLSEVSELRELQRLAGLKRELLSSPSLRELLSVESDLRRRNLWQGQ